MPIAVYMGSAPCKLPMPAWKASALAIPLDQIPLEINFGRVASFSHTNGSKPFSLGRMESVRTFFGRSLKRPL